ncbi:MAG: hypothetical protein ABIF01_03950, partial [Candidatus Micrarchaeota archaeon]
MKKAVLLSLFLALVLVFGCTGGAQKKSCKTDDDCEPWKECNATKGFCQPKPGLCESDSACEPEKFCNPDHICEFRMGNCESNWDCPGWQTCDTVLRKCETAIGFCNGDKYCLNEWEGCDNVTHECVTKKGRCLESLDCEIHELCNASTKGCYPMPGRCNDNSSCAKWQYCELGTKKCMLKPGLCESDSHCKGGEYCNDDEKRCYPRKLTEEEIILAKTAPKEIVNYTLKRTVERNTAGVSPNILGDIAEVPLEKGKTSVAFICNVTEGPATAGVAEGFLFSLIRPEYMQGTKKGYDIRLNPNEILQTNEALGLIRLDSYGGLIVSTANWHVNNPNWKPDNRFNLSKLGIKAGEKFMIIAEFDQKNTKGGTLSLYIENKYGA